MALTAEGLQKVLMEGTMAYFNQLQKDLEVRFAAVLKVADTGVGPAVIINIAKTCARDITEMVRLRVVESGVLEDSIRKLV